MDFPVHAVIAAHDRFQLEFKYDYEIVPNCRTRYKIVTYIFVPQSLSINRFTYPQSDFYRDLKNYVRLKTPDFTLAELASAPGSPLVRIERILATENWKTLPNVDGRLITNFKFLRATLKNALDLCFAETKAEVERRHDHATLAATFSRNLTQASAELDDILSRFRSFSAVIRTSNVDARVQRSFALTDESISLVVEEALIQVIDLIDRHRLRGNLTDLTAELLKRVDEESYHRHACHYASVLSPDTDAGEFLFRMSVLKKFTSSVLYLSTTVQREGTTLEQILFSLAAGVSMIFATVVAFYFQQRYGNFTFPFFLALVVGYMFKDRLKESMRGRSTAPAAQFRLRSTDDHPHPGWCPRARLSARKDGLHRRTGSAGVCLSDAQPAIPRRPRQRRPGRGGDPL